MNQNGFLIWYCRDIGLAQHFGIAIIELNEAQPMIREQFGYFQQFLQLRGS
jgi:hypothetical protein